MKETKDNSLRIPQRDKIRGELKLRPLNWTEKQKKLIELIFDKKTNVVICKGPSGTAKTVITTFCGLQLLNIQRIGEIIYIRTPCESSSFGVGYLKGDLDTKFSPYTWPLEDKLQELLTNQDIDRLKKEKRIITKPLGFIRGTNFNCSYIICEEAQNFREQDFLLTMTRLGKFSKMIFIGDERQSDIKNGALQKVYNLFDNPESKEKGIFTFQFDNEDIMRNLILSFIIDKFDNLK